MRYTPIDFLNKYNTFMSKCNNKKAGSVELSFKRYDCTEESKLPSSFDKSKKHILHAPKSKKPDNNKRDTSIPISGEEASCLVRGKFGDDKVSCVVPFSEVVDFQSQFGSIFRLHTTALVGATDVSERSKKRRLASEKGAKEEKSAKKQK